MELNELIISLCGESGPSGFEDNARDKVIALLNPFVDEIKTDVMGNVIAVKRCGKENARSIMLDAHMDEIGLIVTGHKDGYLRFSTIGGVDQRMLPAREVKILTEPPIYGVIDVLPPHALDDDEMDKSLPVDKMFIDIGMTQEEAEKAVPLATPIVYDGGAQMLGENMICGKALDDRACAAIIIKAMEKLKSASLDVDVYCLISTQEEVGLRGAGVAAYGVHPDYCIVLDVTHGDTPDAAKEKTLKVGGGSAIGIGPQLTRNLTNALIGYAKQNELQYQLEVLSGGTGTNSGAIQLTREGVATALISLPLKYMHTPIETLKVSDAENIVELLAGFISMTGEVG